MITCTLEGMKCDCGNVVASKFATHIQKRRVLEDGKHRNEIRQYLRCTQCSDMITQEDLNQQLNGTNNGQGI